MKLCCGARGILALAAVCVSTPIGARAETVIEEVVVTAQRTEESIQDVPIAITALSDDMLRDRQVITVSDLQMNAPNISFTNTNFGSNSLSIRGIGRLLTAATGDAGVSVHTNEIAIGPNLNTGEFYDMERVEILRGPQGTLYGKNATGGVVNFVTRKPDFGSWNGFLDVEAGNFSHLRRQGAINIPFGESFAIRAAGMWLERDGYTDNLAAGQVGADGRTLATGLYGESLSDEVDGRDQYDIRITASWQITDNANLWVMYQRYDEDSNRARITNQVCVQNDQPTYGCTADEVGFEQPYATSKVGNTLAALYGLLDVAPDTQAPGTTASFNWDRPELDLRTMHTDFEPVYENEADQYFVGFEYAFETFTVEVLGGWFESSYLTQQDYNMDVGATLPINFYRADGLWPNPLTAGGNAVSTAPGNPCNLFDGNAGTDGPPQCFTFNASEREYAFDQSSDETEGWSGEINLQSNFAGPINFLLGYTAFESEGKGDYYVIGNVLDHGSPVNYPGYFNSFSNHTGGTFLEGSSFFGEIYFQLTDDVKLTFGLRRNDDDKETDGTSVLWDATDVNFPLSTALAGNVVEPLFSRIPTFVGGGEPTAGELALIELYAPDADLAGALATGAQSPERLAIHNEVPLAAGFNETRLLTGSPASFNFQETTGRFVVDWAITDRIMGYGQFSRGYKPGGANPSIPAEFQATSGFSFDSETVDAIEFGVKSLLLDGSMILNATAFHYDYKGLQVARIKNNSSINENIDANISGLELEMYWQPEAVPGLAVDLNYSWLDTEVDGSESIDPVDRTGGLDDQWTVLNGFAVLYIAPTDDLLNNLGAITTAGVAAGAVLLDPDAVYPNGIPSMIDRGFLTSIGVPWQEGIPTSLDGNQLPNAPEHQIKLGLGYTFLIEAIKGELGVRWDYYWQDDSYAREFNRPGDLIDSWDQHNLSVIYNSSDGRWNARLWVRNIEDEDNVTGHYLTSDTSGYFRNYFLTEPRIYGLTVRYGFGDQ